MSIPGVVGTGIGECDGKPCIKILVDRNPEELVRTIPKTLEGFPVEIVETGKIRPLHQEQVTASHSAIDSHTTTPIHPVSQ